MWNPDQMTVGKTHPNLEACFFSQKLGYFLARKFYLGWVTIEPLLQSYSSVIFSFVIISFQNFDYEAQENRIRERGIMHVGEEAAYSDGRFFAPASWQAGFAGWKERQGRNFINFLIVILVI